MLYEFVLEDNDNRITQLRKWIEKKLGEENYKLVRAEHVNQARKLLFDHSWDIIFLDHDLNHEIHVKSTEPDTGYQLAKFIAEHQDKIHFNKIIIHSQNVVGAANMHNVLRRSGISSIYSIPFSSLIAHA